jgi:hypothetical protein
VRAVLRDRIPLVRGITVVLLLVAACGGATKPQPQGRPEDVAKAAFEALKVGNIAPLEPHLITAEESRKITGVVLDDSAERERFETLFAHHHERLNVDWDTAVPGASKVKYDPMGVGANVTLPITSGQGTVTIDVAVTKVGRRFVFAGVKPGPGAEPKQAAPDAEGESEDGG